MNLLALFHYGWINVEGFGNYLGFIQRIRFTVGPDVLEQIFFITDLFVIFQMVVHK
jgi:hypothetical protein